jgi:penicillin-binding protein 2
MGIFRRTNHRRYGSAKPMEFRRFGSPTKDSPKERSADEVFLGRRMFIFKSIAASCFAAVTVRIGYLQLGQRHTSLLASAVTQNLRKQVVKAPRGLITDRNGATLAENRKAWGLALVRAKLPKEGDPQREAMFQEVEKYIPLEWALTVKPLGPRALPSAVEDLAQRLAPHSDRYDTLNLGRLLVRINDDPILLHSTLSKEDVPALRREIGATPGINFLRYAEFLVSPANQPDANRPTLVKRGLDRNVAIALDANALDFPGMFVDESLLTRHYPQGDLVAHVLGYVGPVSETDLENDQETGEPIYQKDDIIGRIGIEAALESDLRGRTGTRFYYVDSLEIDRGTAQLVPAITGRNLELSLDLNLQRAARDALQKQMPLAQAAASANDPGAFVHSAVAIALDPRNGELLAMVSLPAYDNQAFVDGKDLARINAYLKDATTKPMLNKALYETYPPGSTLKPFMAAAGLQAGTIKLETIYNCPGIIQVPYSTDERTFGQYTCWVYAHHIAPHGPQNVVDAIAHSCDVFFYNVGAPGELDKTNDQILHYYEYSPTRGLIRRNFEGLGIDRMDHYFNDFGFGTKTGITDLRGEEIGVVPTPDFKAKVQNGDPWSVGDTINATIGQGYFSCTPLQLATATAAIANGGAFYRPHLVRRVFDENGNTIRTADATPLRKSVVEDKHLDLVRQGMRKVVGDPSGTAATHINVPGVTVAGKTGTAEFGEAIAVPGKQLTYQRQHAWFTAYAPYESPEIVVAVLIVGGGEGATFATPVANDILNAYFKAKGSPKP